MGTQAAAAAQQAGAYVNKQYRATLGAGTVSVGSSTVLASTLTATGQLSNLGTVGFTNASIHVASGVVPDALSALLAPGTDLFTAEAVLPGTMSADFDSSRTFSPGTIPAGSSSQRTTVTVGLPGAILGVSSVFLVVKIDGGPAATGWSPFLIPPGAILSASGPNWVKYVIAASPGDSFTFQVDVAVNNTSGAPANYRPQADVSQTYTVPVSSTGTGPVGINDFDFGTTVFSVGEPTPWDVAERIAHTLTYTGLQPAAAPAPLPQVQANALAFGYVNLLGSQDSVANQSYLGQRGWRGELQNFQPTLVPGPRIQLDTVNTATWAFTPPPVLPADTGVLADLGQGQQAALRTVAAEGPGTSRVDNTPVVTGYHGSRSLSPTSVIAGATQTATISITLDDPSFAHGFAEIDVFPHDPSNPSNGNQINSAGAVNPTLSNGESLNVHPINADGFAWQINNAAVGATYTLQVPINVVTAGVFKPFVTLRGGTFTGLPPVTGTSTTINDPQLGGTWTYSSTAAGGVTFNRGTTRVTSTNFQAVVPAAATPDYAVSLDQSEFTVHAGSQFSPTVTLSPQNGFASSVGAYLCSGTGPGQYAPPGFFQQGFYSNQLVGPGSPSFGAPIDVSQSVAAGDYTFGICTYTPSLPLPSKLTTFTVHVLAALPQANAGVFRSRQVWVGSGDTVTNASQTLHRFWGASIYNWGSTTLHGPAMSLGGSAVDFSPPFASFPVTTGTGGDLGQYASMYFNELAAHQPSNVTDAPGYTASRTMSSTQIPVAGGTQDVTLSITPVAADAADGYLGLELHADNFLDAPGATIVAGSVHFTPLTHGEGGGQTQLTSTAVNYSIDHPAPGVTYTLELQIYVANTAGTVVNYKPWSRVSLWRNTWGATHEGTDVSVIDPLLGGTFSYSSNDTVNWHPLFVDDSTAYFQSANPARWSAIPSSSTISVPAGSTVLVPVTVHTAPGVTGDVNIFLRGPSGLMTGCCGPFTGNDGDVVQFPVHIGADVPAGTVLNGEIGGYIDGIAGESLSPLTVTVTAAVATASLNVFRNARSQIAANVDSTGATDALTATRGWDASIWNSGSATIPAVSLSADGSALTFTPSIAFPLTVGPLDVASQDSLWSSALSGWGSNSLAAGQPTTSGFDVTRSATPALIPPGGGDQTVTVTITARDPVLAGHSLYLHSETDSDIGGTVIDTASISSPATTHGESTFDYATSYYVDWGASGVVIGVPYTLSYVVHVPNSGATPLRYKPLLVAEGFHFSPITTEVGTSATIADSVLGGTWTAAAGISVTWEKSVGDAEDLIFNSLAVSTAPVDHFAIRVLTAAPQAGSPFSIQITPLSATNRVVTTYRGPVQVDDSNGNVSGPVSWSAGGIGTTTMTSPDEALNDRIYVTDTSTGGTAYTASAPFQIFGALDHFKVAATPPMGQTSTAVGITITPMDSVNHALTTFSSSTLTLADSQAIAGTTFSPVSWTRGIGTASATFTNAVRNDTIVATDGAVTNASNTFSRSGPATRFVVSVLPVYVPVTGTATVKVFAYDAVGNVATGYTGTPSLSDTAGVGTFGSAPAVNGVSTSSATFTGPAKGDKVTATDGALVSPLSNAFNVIGAATRLAVSVLPANVPVAGTVTVKVTAFDGAGNVATGYTETPSLTDTAGVGTFGSAAAVNGVSTSTATFTGPAKADKATATDGSLTSPLSNAFNVIGEATRLALTVSPANVPVTGTATVKVTAYDAVGNVATGYTEIPSVSDSAGVGSFGSVAAVNGVSTSTATFTAPAKADKATATDGSLTSPPGNAFNVIGEATHLTTSVVPATLAVADTATVRVTALDSAGNVATGYAGSPTLSDTSGVASFVGPAAATNGLLVKTATFSGPARNDKVNAVDGALPSPGSSLFNVIGPAVSFRVAISAASVTRPAALTVTATALDAAGNTVYVPGGPSYAGPVTYSDSKGVVAPGPFDQVWTRGVGVAHVTFTGATTNDRISVTDSALPGLFGTAATLFRVL